MRCVIVKVLSNVLHFNRAVLVMTSKILKTRKYYNLDLAQAQFQASDPLFEEPTQQENSAR